MNKLIPNLALALFIAAVISPVAPAGVNAGQKRAEPRNIVLEFLDMEKNFGAGKAQADYINRLIETARVKIPVVAKPGRSDALATLKGIDALIRGEGFVFRNNFLLCKGIDTRVIDCDNYCALYTAIAEELKIPIIPVYAPNHSFIRFYFEDGTYINWETTKAEVYDDDAYIKKLGIDDISLREGVYLKSLSRKEFIGVEYNNIGAYLMTGKKFSDAVPYFTMAISCYPKFSSAYHNRGTSYYATRRLKPALRDLLTACNLDPNRATSRNTLGDIYLDLGDYGPAEEQFRAAIRLDPSNYVPYNSIAVIMKITGRPDEARQWLRKSQDVKNRNRR